MMQNVHLAPETDEDDLYSGYNDYNPTYDTEELENDTAFQQAVRTSHGRRPPITAKIPSTAVTRPVATGYGSKTSLASSMGRPMTGAIQDGVTRPMTAVRAAGFTKAAFRGSAFDPLGQSRGPAPPLETKNEDSPEEKIRQLEKKVNELVEESCIANSCGDLKLALEKAKDAGRKERVLVRQREQVTTPENINLDLTYLDDTHTNLVIEAIKNDHLRQMECERKAMAEKYIMTAAKLIAPVIESSFAVGYDWCVEVVKASQYVELANDLEINKAITYLRQKDFNQAVETLKMFEKKDSRVKSAAATNLSFLYYLENEFAQASSYADLAVNSDRYNPSALTNKGNTVFANGDYEKAAEFYKEALRNDSSCTEALYNIGLTYKKLNRLEEALDCFLKLHAILRNSAQVLYQIANVYELMEDPNQAIEWLMQLISVVPTDSRALSKLGELYDSEGDKSQAFQYYYESYRYFPSNIDVIEWLGAYYIDTQFCEKAIQYFERASLIQPMQVKWQLMVASCFRRSGNYQKALDTYKDIHRKFPENVECLRFLVRLCTDIGLKEVQEYATKLKRLEKMKEIREQRIKSGRDGSGGTRSKREGSAGHESGQNCSASSKGERLSAKLRTLPGTNEPYESSSNKEIGKCRCPHPVPMGTADLKKTDASYVDPLGPQTERPKTAAKKRVEEEDFADEDLGDYLLPE
ncbi:PREDICTED: intraflagellar transport protein 88 homolog isoform X8 [Hipposideros armiger]|uniref:Intraflagellar transport protein 88 homolog isoform X8 n=1 Tax=Hipposideros armiger TaxID=186990 RepID=A0A8B7S4K7_HIPAR|nr:PREDICTED: intraflagellar transport protein 88 homolog isoform X8 [Hipposideros armiger]